MRMESLLPFISSSLLVSTRILQFYRLHLGSDMYSYTEMLRRNQSQEYRIVLETIRKPLEQEKVRLVMGEIIDASSSSPSANTNGAPSPSSS